MTELSLAEKSLALPLDVAARSLGGAHGSVMVPAKGSTVRRFLAFAGPGYLVATGYMDPGNWATALAGGSKFGTALLFVAVLSSLMAIVLQALSARLAFATGRDLAQICRDVFPKPVSLLFWLIMEVAIIATDLAEVIGTAIGIELLTGLPLGIGVILTAFDALLVLAFMRFGFRKLEAFVVSLLIVIAACFFIELVLARPDMAGVARGLLPTSALFSDTQMLYIALGILGATVMPHNLYLHSGIVLTRAVGTSVPERKSAIRLAIADSTLALTFALLINGSILILAAAAFHAHGHFEVAELPDAYRLIAPLLGSALAAKLFAVALIACGLNSTLTATLAGQIVMEGFVNLKLNPVARRLLTRSVAIVPAIVVIYIGGEGATNRLLILSQVILSLALPFAVTPLVWLTASRKRMGELKAPLTTSAIAWVIAAIIIGLNAKLLIDTVMGS
ncbi:Mn2+/Fe2+ transporter, NRAMP family [Methylocella silvestris BL2]|uniref:Divalent metal cation transporter MntH n=1 Tax=Methylocella silvestris (strain DSM 15510 / CIP 108128 / LMG 27833 / NCIMB 13906 / BL2) TaxID=395965 RepID=B8EK94_METSB|nr:Nramp family divalent metal transporter [Methylocella silvestris]ACK50634.1 Mn2+/Fe2+ transporter, NRAMP family [Methylocella silvestris BL2]